MQWQVWFVAAASGVELPSRENDEEQDCAKDGGGEDGRRLPRVAGEGRFSAMSKGHRVLTDLQNTALDDAVSKLVLRTKESVVCDLPNSNRR